MINHLQLATLCRDSYQSCTFQAGDVQVLHHMGDDFDVFAICGPDAEYFFSLRSCFGMLWGFSIWPYKGGRHSFVNGWFKIQAYIIRNTRIGVPVILTGHGVGGAIAAVGQGELIQLLPYVPIVHCITFGAPKALILKSTNWLLLGIMQNSSTQYSHMGDPIPGLLKWAQYQHVSQTLVGDGKRDFKNHSIENYMKEMDK